MNRGQLAADIHAQMCNDNRFGYSWEERWGAYSESWTIDGQTFPMSIGDYDCSSSTITAWKKALYGTPYADALDGAITTRNMRSVFVGSGLFEWKPMSFLAEPGDLYLNEADHVAMCQTQYPDVLSEFSWGDNGAYGNQRGDQSGYEAYIHGYYEYPWDGILHYNGKADSEPKPEPAPVPVKSRLTAIDIAHPWQAGIVPSETEADIVIVKATGGVSYVNPCWKEWADNVIASGKQLGLYHYAWERNRHGSAAQEARFFLDTIKDYIGKAVIILDWENEALTLPQSWAKQWLDTVAKETGSTPFFYCFAAHINSTDFSSVAAKYPLWMASYLNRYIGSDLITDPDNVWDTGDWDDMTMYQYTSQGDIENWNGSAENDWNSNIDLSVFYGSVEDWKALIGGKKPEPKPVGDNIRYRASTDPNGYSWLPDMIGRYDTGGSSDTFAGEIGVPLRWLAIEGVGKYRVCTQASGWLPWVNKFNPSDLENGCAGDGSPIIALEIPSSDVRYALHDLYGGWNPDMIGNHDTGGSGDSYAGSMEPADAVRIEWA